jgi:catechol 2,3-dioxygenase-like lactoylglutathione lyase family enzyme
VIEINRIVYIRVPVDDIKKARHFYGEVLGLPRPSASRVQAV